MLLPFPEAPHLSLIHISKKYLSEYFDGQQPDNPYEENPEDIRTVTISPNGDTLGSNVYHTDIIDIIENYKPIKKL